MLIDRHGRIIDYLRLAVTDRCNLRCFYCMPEEGIEYFRKESLLSYEECLRIVSLLAQYGVKKVRITGGEPFLRKGIMSLFREMVSISGIETIAITTNGTLIMPYLDELVSLGIRSINLSIDSIDKERFNKITRRNSFDEVWTCYQNMIDRDIDLKLNFVVMNGQNIEDLIPMVELTENENISVRFIEEMPFNGKGKDDGHLEWDHSKILEHISTHFGKVEKLVVPETSTSFNYKIPEFKGSFGIIPAYTRSFCGTCNRLRITPNGTIKTCLYDDGIFNIKDLMRAGADDQQLIKAIKEAIGNRAVDGFEAEKNRHSRLNVSESMATIGG